MAVQDKTGAATLSRRSMLRRIAIAGSAAAVSQSRKALAKSSQKAVRYQDTPHGNQECDNCREFEPPSSCKVVEGVVSPKGWCKVYIRKPPGT